MANEDLYSLLGVPRTSTKDEIKKAYRKLARELHPDRKNNKSAEERFKKVSAAYAVLGDEEKRKLYDQYGIDGLRDGFDPNMWKQYGGGFAQGRRGGGAPNVDFGGGFDFGGFQGFGAMEDIFESLFGKRGGRSTARGVWQTVGGASSNSEETKGHQVKSILEVDLMDSILGRELDIVVPLDGEKKKLRIRLPMGIEDGKTIRLKEQGGRSRLGGTAGDLMLEIRIKKNRIYEREGLDLIKKEKITVIEAYEGTQKEVETPWGPVKITIPEGTQGGSKLRLKGKGIKKENEKGDLYLQITVQIPTKKDEKTKQAVRNLKECY